MFKRFGSDVNKKNEKKEAFPIFYMIFLMLESLVKMSFTKNYLG